MKQRLEEHADGLGNRIVNADLIIEALIELPLAGEKPVGKPLDQGGGVEDGVEIGPNGQLIVKRREYTPQELWLTQARQEGNEKTIALYNALQDYRRHIENANSALLAAIELAP